MPFFHFSQNNSGGFFHFEADRGITHHVVIEAPTAEAANVEAIVHGLYFNGCESGQDCHCCGDRWSPMWGVGGTAKPQVYNHVLGEEPYRQIATRMAPKPECVVHYAEGAKVWYDQDGRKVEFGG